MGDVVEAEPEEGDGEHLNPVPLGVEVAGETLDKDLHELDEGVGGLHKREGALDPRDLHAEVVGVEEEGHEDHDLEELRESVHDKDGDRGHEKEVHAEAPGEFIAG